ncbi:histidine triad nucleotide-binding protein 3-like isoform X1 [Thalassophryne amazonica]|uniref:histidine triad nucleotide-binding protein 3-like isoform X1 n=1 Tax=Thalassophryne amazonica TaxID=390379 RepID=UPI001471663C|nr:histidine triad nucleotide-binding protein 3-like isoform X1 [Thalassophryne amazonica]
MEEQELNSEIDESCIFCLIAHGKDKDTEIIQKNKELVCFRDIFPAAPHHYLVIPKQHIRNCFSLNEGHVDLVEQMVDMGKAVLHDKGITDMKNTRLGFHKPPFISVDHLHLHVLAPTSQICDYMLYKFTPGTASFINENVLQDRFKNVPHSGKRGIGKYLWF